MPEKQVYIAEISQEIKLRRNTRIKRLSIKIGVGSGVIVCVPKGVSDAVALQFVHRQELWIKRHLNSEKYQKQSLSSVIQLLNAEIHFTETEHNKTAIQREDSVFSILLPKKYNSSEREEIKRTILNKILRIKAKEFLPLRVAELAKLHGFQYGKLSFRNQKTRWGSCSYHNNISLNIQLMRLPLHLIDYVIIHELCHTVHKNHSAKFWQLVYKKIGESLYFCKKEMRNQKIEL